MEKIQDFNEGNAFIKNVYFGFEEMLTTNEKNKEKDEINYRPKIIKNKTKNKKKSKSKNKEKSKLKKNAKEYNNIIVKPTKPMQNEEEEEIVKDNKKKSKKNSKQKKKKEIKREEIIKNEDSVDENIEDDKKSKSKSKKKKKSKSKCKEKKQKKKKKSKNKSKNKEVQTHEEKTIKKDINDDILDEIEFPKYNEIKDDAMNVVDKHIHDLSLTFMKRMVPKKENNLSSTKLKIKRDNKKKTTDNKIKNIINNNFNNMDLLLTGNDIVFKRPYTAHGYKVKSKTKRLPKILKPNQEEEKIMAFKEKVYVHDKTLSLFNNYNLIDKVDEKQKLFSKTEKPKRINSALTKNAFHHYMMPKKQDILKLQKIKKKEVEYYSDKYEEDPEEIKKDEKEENDIKNKNDKAISLINSSHKIYGKSQQSINDIKNVLNKENIDTFMNNFLIKHNFTTKKEESKLSNKYYNIPDIKFYHGGKKYYKPKKEYINENKQNNSDNNLLNHRNDKRYKLFNPKEIISNPNNKFNFFNQTFTKEPIYGKYFESPEIEKSINNKLGTIPSNKWNPGYKIKKFIKEEKENPNDVYNYDYKYDDLNSDSDNELPNNDFKARTMPKFKKIKFDYKNYKTGKIIKEKDDKKITNNDNNNYMDKNISHPFLIDDDYVNI